jgi:cytochrome c oxidase assembly protein subunit 15
VAATLALVFIGGLVTSTGSGLSVPDWPLSYGMLMPPMVGGVFFEHGHRMAASTVGFLVLVLALWTARREPRRAVRTLAWCALGIVIAQGVLGGLTVIFLLPTAVSVAHACLAQTFFCVVIALAYVTSQEWLSAEAAHEDGGMRASAAIATGLAYIQLVLGAIMRHIGAGLAIPDFPLAFGRVVPPLASRAVLVHFAHRVGALLVFSAIVVLFMRAWRSGDSRLGRSAALALGLVTVQIGLGAATVLSGKAVLPTTLHVATGAAVLGACWLATLRAYRLTRAAAAVPAAAPRFADPQQA